jgi:hypothetical protein
MIEVRIRILLTNGSGRPKNFRILRIRIRNTDEQGEKSTRKLKHSFYLATLKYLKEQFSQGKPICDNHRFLQMTGNKGFS